LLSYRDESGELRVLTKSVFLKRCNKAWARHNVPRMTGHCFRIGGTTYYLTQGIAPDIVKMLGRWKSDAFLKYWRDLDSLASIHLHRHHAQRSYAHRLQTSRTQNGFAPY
ncbi:hypothetical protein BT96DRAFT_839276, partial [Gymnopus androsaceus JB14]